MTLAVDASTPAIAHQTGVSLTVTTASFTPPAGARLLIRWIWAENTGETPTTPSIADNRGAPLTYTLLDWKSKSIAPAASGQAAQWTTTTPAGTPVAMTITVTANGQVANYPGSLQVEVLTDDTTPGIGAHGTGGANTPTTSISPSYTGTAAGSWGRLTLQDWDAGGAPTPGSGMTATGGGVGLVTNSNGSVGYAFVRRTTADGTVGGTTSLPLTTASSSNLAWVYAEITPGAAATPTVALDASSPAVAVTTSSPTVTSPSFTAPAESLLVALWAQNSTGTATGPPSITNSGTVLTWTLQEFSQTGEGVSGAMAEAAIWTAPVPAGATVARTVSVTGFDNNHALKVQVWTGNTGQPIPGAHTEAGFAGTNSWALTYTATETGSRGVMALSDWDNTGPHTAGANTTLTGGGSAASVNFSYTFALQATAAGVDGASVTLTVTDPTVSAHVRAAALEVSPPSTAATAAGQYGWGTYGGGDYGPNYGQTGTSAAAGNAAVAWVAAAPAAAVTANGGAGAVSVTAADGTAAPAPAAGSATVTWAAGDPAAAVTVPAGNAAAAVTAQDATASVAPAAGESAVAVTAYDATVLTATPTDAPAEHAAVAYTAPDAAVSVAGNAGVGAYTLTAQDAMTAVASPAGAATTAVTAFDATVQAVPHVQAPAEHTAITVTAYDPAAAGAAAAGSAAASVTAADGTAAAGPSADHAPVAVTAYDATVSTLAQTAAAADHAPVGFTGHDPSTAVAAPAGASTVGWSAGDASPAAGAQAAEASTTLTAGLASASVGVPAGNSTVTVTAYDATVSTTVSPAAGNAPVTVTAYDATVSTVTVETADAEPAALSVQAHPAATAVTAGADPAPLSVTAGDASTQVGPTAGQSPVPFTAHDAAVLTGRDAPAEPALTGYVAHDAATQVTSTGGTASQGWAAFDATVQAVSELKAFRDVSSRASLTGQADSAGARVAGSVGAGPGRLATSDTGYTSGAVGPDSYTGVYGDTYGEATPRVVEGRTVLTSTGA